MGKVFNALTFIFVLLTIILRFSVNLEDNLDYEGYILWDNSPINYNLLFLFTEPYFYVLSNFYHAFTNSTAEALSLVYYTNFIITTWFFVWLASKKDVLLWKKILLFTFYYFLFAYTALRNGPAYILLGYMFYAIQRNRKYFAGYFSFLAHTSSFPAILSTFLKYKKPTMRIVFFIAVLSLSLAVVMQLSVFEHISNKYDAYTDTDSKREVTLFHQVYFAAMVLVNIHLFLNNRKYVYNNIYLFMIMLYFWMYFQNPVMAFRFSVYIVLFLCLQPVTVKKKGLDLILNAMSAIFVVGYIYTFYSNHR